MTPKDMIKELKFIEKNLFKARQRTVSETKKKIVPHIKREIIKMVPALKKGIAKGFSSKAKITHESNGRSTTTIKVLPNQPNMRRFLMKPKTGTWQKKSKKARRRSTPNGGLFVRSPQNQRQFIKGAFSKKILNQTTAIVWKRVDNKMVAVKGYSTLAFLKGASNKTAPRFLERKYFKWGTAFMLREYKRQLDVIGV